LLERRGRQVAGDGERRAVGAEQRRAVEPAHMLIGRRRPGVRVRRSGTWRGRGRKLAAQFRCVEHLEIAIEDALRPARSEFSREISCR
jgi:hypothetical protein